MLSPISNRCVGGTRGWRLVGTGTVVQVVHEAPCLQCVVLGGLELRRKAGCSALSSVSAAGGSMVNVVAVRGTTGSICGATCVSGGAVDVLAVRSRLSRWL